MTRRPNKLPLSAAVDVEAAVDHANLAMGKDNRLAMLARRV
jgi:hypothetical protein